MYLLFEFAEETSHKFNFESIYFMSFLDILLHVVFSVIVAESAGKELRAGLTLKLAPSLVVLASHRVSLEVFFFYLELLNMK